MADEPENLTLRMLRQVDAKLDTLADRMHDFTAHVASVEDQVAGIKTDISALRSDFVRLEHRFDPFDERLLHIERRLDLIDA